MGFVQCNQSSGNDFMLRRSDVCFRDKVLVCPMKSAPVLLTVSDSKYVVLPVDDDSDLNVVAAFDRRGEYIYTGNAKGKVSLTFTLYDTVYTVFYSHQCTLKVLSHTRCRTFADITQL